ncbi:MAG: biopolymer transporter ExbD [Oscillatoriales cyanobacterium]|nr:MAG: biopolymer transporter ExbD [Oscillatoriales cyanobacterium]
MKLNFESSADDARIEILPLMDVIFCILTFFILGAVGLSRQQALTQNLPKASTGDSSMSQMLPVSIDASGQIYLSRETQPISFQDLAARLARHQQTSPNEPIVLYANPSVEYDRVMQVLDLIREIGGERATLGITPSSRSALDRNSDLRQPLLSPLERLRANPENQIDFGNSNENLRNLRDLQNPGLDPTAAPQNPGLDPTTNPQTPGLDPTTNPQTPGLEPTTDRQKPGMEPTTEPGTSPNGSGTLDPRNGF